MARPSARPLLLVALAALACALGCPDTGNGVVGPDGERLSSDECLLTVDIDPSCDGCEGFERYELVVNDAAGASWTFTLAEGESWTEVVARGEVELELEAILYGGSYPYIPESFTCTLSYDVSLGCLGFDFCGE